MEPERLLSRREVQQLYGVSTYQLYEATRQGKIPCFKLGGLWKYPKAAVDKWVAENVKDRRIVGL